MPVHPSTDLGGEARVIESVERDVAQRRLRPGSRLLTERDLATRSGESRTTVRRALKVLESRGLVVRHVGRGTFLARDWNGASGDASPAGTSPSEIMAARLLIEPAMMPVVVTAATPVDVEEMQRCLVGQDRADGYDEFEAWDAAFHRAIAEATHNRLLLRVIEMINAVRLAQPLWGSLKRRSFTEARRAEYRQDHHEIVDALVERDGPAAQDAMRRHLLRVRAHLIGEHA